MKATYSDPTKKRLINFYPLTFEIPNNKQQITNKSQIPILNDQNGFGD
jgi:hypothetical protein